MLTEIFKEIPHYPNYEVSALGVVRNAKKGNTLKWVDNGKGYKMVKLYNSSKPTGRLCLIHRVVLSTFDPMGRSDLDVNHIDGDKSNNRLTNLEWTTKSNNTRHAHMTGLFNGRNKLTIEQVREIKVRLRQENRESYSKISRDYNVLPWNIIQIARGKLWGYV